VVAVYDPVEEGVNEYQMLFDSGLGPQLGLGSPGSVVDADRLSLSLNGRLDGEITVAFAKSSLGGAGRTATDRFRVPLENRAPTWM
jgi:hypothetical protein